MTLQFFVLELARKNHALGEIDELIAGWRALEQTLRVCSRACFTIKDSKQPIVIQISDVDTAICWPEKSGEQIAVNFNFGRLRRRPDSCNRD